MNKVWPIMGRPRASAAGAVLIALLLLIAPSLFNGGPFVFFDTFGYMRAGQASIDFAAGLAERLGDGGAAGTATAPLDTKGDGVQASRSVYYGIPLALSYMASGSIWLAALSQVLIAALALVRGLQWCGLQGRWLLGATALIAGLSGMAVYAGALMPDIFSGLAILSLGLLLTRFDRMAWPERGAWLLLLLYGLMVHKAHLAIVGALLVLAVPTLLLLRRMSVGLGVILASVCALALGAHMAVGVVVSRVAGETTVSLPFMLARLIGDGTASKYLAAHCSEVRFEVCDYLPRMPMTEEEFLYSKSKDAYFTADLAERERVNAEASAIILGTVREHGLEQAAISAGNAVRQFFTVGVSDYGRVVELRPNAVSGAPDLAAKQKDTLMMRGEMPLVAMSQVVWVVYVASLVLLLAALSLGLMGRLAWSGSPVLLPILCLGLLANAAVSGVIAGTFDRYQGRVAWLMLFAAVVVAHDVWRQRGDARAAPRAKA